MSVAEIFGVGGPFAAVAAIVGYFLSYLIKKRGVERESESGIVETTNATLAIVRTNQEALAADVRALRDENNDLRYQLRKKDEQIDKLTHELGSLSDQLMRIEKSGLRDGVSSGSIDS